MDSKHFYHSWIRWADSTANMLSPSLLQWAITMVTGLSFLNIETLGGVYPVTMVISVVISCGTKTD